MTVTVAKNRLLVFFTLSFFMVLFSVSTVDAGIYPWRTQFRTVQTEHFDIHYQDDLAYLASELQMIAEPIFQKLTERHQWEPKDKIHVVLADNTDVANGLATVIPANYITLYAVPPQADSTLDHYRHYLELLFTHELTHIVHIDQHRRVATPFRWLFGKIIAPNGSTPTWIREGLAVYEESRVSSQHGRNNFAYTQMVLRTSYYEDTFPRIDQIAGSTKNFPGGFGPYLYGGIFHEWIAQTFGEERLFKFQEENSSGLFLLSAKSRRVFGKSFTKLWKDFRNDMSELYERQKQEIEKHGLTELETVIQNKHEQSYYTVHPQGRGYAYFENNFDEASKIVIHLDDQKPIHIQRRLFGQMSFSPSGRYLAFSSLAAVERKRAFSEVFYYDLKNKKLYRAFPKGSKNEAMRAKDPDFSPQDGGQRWLVMVRHFAGTDQLYVYDTYEKSGYIITNAAAKTQFAQPRFSPDGRHIVVSRKDENGQRDIVLYSNTGKEIRKITDDFEPDYHPVFSRDGQKIYYSSYKTGIANIFAHDVGRKETKRLTNVLTGVFQPMPSPNNGEIFVQKYSTRKSHIVKFAVGKGSRVFTPKKSPAKEYIYNISAAEKNVDESDFKTALLEKQKDKNPIVAKNPTQQISPEKSFTSEADQIPQGENGLKQVDEKRIAYLHSQGQHQFCSHAQTNLPTVKNPYRAFFKDVTASETLPSGFENLPDEPDYDPEENTQDDSYKKNTGSQEAVKSKKTSYPSAYKNALGHFPQQMPELAQSIEGSKKYNPLKHLFPPKYIIPNATYFEDSLLLGFSTGRFDPLYRHAWNLDANYRSDAGFFGGSATYIYSRFDPTFYVGAMRYAVDWGYVNGVNFFEQRHQAYAGMSYTHKKHNFNVAYFYEDRAALTNLSSINLVNMEPYAGLRFTYNLSDYKKYPHSISQENGYRLKLGYELTDSLLGSDQVNEGHVFYGDARLYIEMPYADHHVIALRVAGGAQLGDLQQFGAFRLGGPFGEGTGGGYSSRVFPLRGLSGISFAGDHVFIFSGEYRFPINVNVNRGVGTAPVFLDKLHMDFFVDGGDIRFRTSEKNLFDRLLVSVGAEVKGDFVLGYGLPMTVRAGYGIILTNRDRIASFEDSLTGLSMKYGNIYLQVGTSF